jgi:alpha-tubulin suppressor-like RCC1 family protein
LSARRALRGVATLCAVALLAGLLGVAGVAVDGAIAPTVPAAAADPVPGGLGFTAITPCRLADTRAVVESTDGLTGVGGRLVDGGSLVVQVDGTGGSFTTQGGTAGGCGLPEAVSAVEISVTVVDPIGTGYLRAHAGNAPVPTATFINYSGQSTTNTGTVPVAPGQFVVEDLRLTNFGAQTHVIVDVQGYYTPAGTLGYVPLASPCRAGDTRFIVTSGGQKFNSGALVGFRLTGATGFDSQGGTPGGCGVPAGVTAVELSLTAIEPEGNGFLRLQAGLTPPTTTFLNFAGSIATTNTGTTRIEPLLGTDINVSFFGRTHVAVDIQGYFTSAPGSARYQTVTPCRVFDTRAVGGPAGVGGPFPDGVTRHLQTSGDLGNFRSQGGADPTGCDVPQGAAAIEASLTAVAPTAAGFTRPYPVGGTPTGTFLNLSAGRSTTNTGSLGLGARGMDDLAIKHFGGSSHYLLDVFGYFVSSSIVFPTAESVDAGGDHTCALMTTSGVRCWGEADNGRLGRNESTLPFADGNSAENVLTGPSSSLTGIAQVSAGGSSACALTVETEIQCWGSDSSGQLGDTTAGGSSSVAVFVRRPEIGGQAPAVTGFVQVAVGGSHACALSTTGTVFCWGENGKGQLGKFDTNDSATPQVVRTTNAAGPALGNVVQVVAGREHTCALIADGTARCWGSSDNGQLGHGEGGGFSYSFAPQTVRQTANSATPFGGIVELAAGARNTCALLVDSTVRCWGDDSDGQLGNSAPDTQLHPVPEIVRGSDLNPLTGVVAISVGSDSAATDHHACALTAAREARCWGLNQSGQLGRGFLSGVQFTPAPVLDGSTAPAQFGEITAGGRHTCGLAVGTTPGGRCWGDNTSGKLGAGFAGGVATNPGAVANL